jgi:hypothetical protein
VATGQSTSDLKVNSLALNGGTIERLASLGFTAPTTFAAGPTPRSVTTADLNGDGKLDLVVAETGGVAVLLGNGSASFGAATAYGAGSSPSSVTTADVNGDGKLDLIVADSGGNSVAVLLGNGSASFGAATTYAAGPNPQSVTTADVNLDGKLDLVVADYDGGVAILLGNGSASFGAATTYAAGPNPQFVTTADVNGDGKLDLLVADVATVGGGVAVLLGNGSASFGAATTYAAGPQPNSVTTADVNGDGKLDLLVARNVSTTMRQPVVEIRLGL